MDIEKVLGIFKELIEEDDKHKIANLLNNLLAHITANNSAAADETISKIQEYSKKSIVNEYAFSKLKVLEKINAMNYFGSYLKEFLDALFTKETYKIKDNLSAFIKQRNTLLTNLKKNIQDLESLDFTSYYETIKTFEIGLIIPKEKAELKDVQIYLKNWHFVLKHVSELTETDHSEPKVCSVSSNSVGIFILGSYLTITCILKISKDVLEIYEKVLKIRKLKQELEEFDLKNNIKEVNEKEKQIVNVEQDKIVKKLLSEYKLKIKKGRENELKNAIGKSVEIVIKMHDEGIVIEATPPKIKEPKVLEAEETEENKKERDKAKKEYDSKIARINEVTGISANIAKIVKELTSSGKGILQIAQYLDKDTKQESEEKVED